MADQKQPRQHVLRIAGSGVWLCARIMRPDPEFPGTFCFIGRRAHRWTDAVDCSALSTTGPGLDSRITDEVETSVPSERLIETHPMSPEAIQRVKSIPVARPIVDTPPAAEEPAGPSTSSE